ncbi:MAG: hypothetical protein PHS07_00230 [Patescibacteria group bacterium]|nr:hypothetical protein [Patescibacteria group bacterium]
MAKINLYENKINEIVERIILDARLCVKEENKKLEEKFKRDSAEFQEKYLDILFQFVYFFIDQSIRLAISMDQNSEKFLPDELISRVGKKLIDMVFTESSEEYKLKILDIFNDKLDIAINNYSKCTTFMVSDKEDFAYADKCAAEMTSKGLVNCLQDEIAKILDDPVGLLFWEHIRIVMQILNVSEYKDLISNILESFNLIKTILNATIPSKVSQCLGSFSGFINNKYSNDQIKGFDEFNVIFNEIELFFIYIFSVILRFELNFREETTFVIINALVDKMSSYSTRVFLSVFKKPNDLQKEKKFESELIDQFKNNFAITFNEYESMHPGANKKFIKDAYNKVVQDIAKNINEENNLVFINFAYKIIKDTLDYKDTVSVLVKIFTHESKDKS